MEQELVNSAKAELVESRYLWLAPQSPKNSLDLAGQIEFADDFHPDSVRIDRYVIN